MRRGLPVQVPHVGLEEHDHSLGVIGLACSTAFTRTLPATVAAYGAAFVLLAGSLLFGLLFPTDIDPNATRAPAPPAVSYLSPLLPLVTIGTNSPVTWYGVRNSPVGFSSACAGPYGSSCAVPLGPNGVAIGKGFVRTPPQPTGTAIPSGLFSGWQYWQATVTMQLLLSLAALIVSAALLPPIRHLPWRRPTVRESA